MILNPVKLYSKAILLFVLVLILLSQAVLAQSTMKDTIEQIINNNELSKTAIVSISVRKANTSQLVYERYGNLLLHTASCLKALSTAVVLEIMGVNEKLSTDIYKYNNNLYIRLSGDPLLKSTDLNDLAQVLKTKGITSINGNIIIDDSIIDDIPWGVGWMWDDENNPLMPKFSPYNLDQNVITINVVPSTYNSRPLIQIIPKYPVKIVNSAVTSKTNSLKIERKPWNDPETIFVYGTIHNTIKKSIPVGSPENYFKARFINALKSNSISFSGNFLEGKVPTGAELLTSRKRGILELLSFTNQKSNNLAAETLFKIASAKYFKTKGTTQNALKVFSNFYSSWGACSSSQEIVDASGASHNDLLQANWITLALSKIYMRPWFNQYINTLAQPGYKGTLQNRFLSLKGSLWAKTGTLSGISGIVGYVKARSGNIYAFTILVQNYKGSSNRAKQLENHIVNTIYNY